ncbi:nucleotidyltransferase domain-containing protein [bacterium]|nr:nucleotidyltransferase domain-containing protein [bacterium]MBU1599646.1 nucleotidyltransferase domain-containing protein [bacterium]
MLTKEKEALKEYFGKRPEVAFTFLFGSQASGKVTSLSDVDIALYFYPQHPKPIEFEEPQFYKQETEIWVELERLLKKEVELIVLNRAPATISASAIRGVPIVIKDWGLYLDFMETVTSEAIDFRDMLINEFLVKVKV